MKFEVEAIMRYLQNLKSKGSRPWFQLSPVDNPRYNFMIWKGQLMVLDRPEVKFDIRILLTSDFPKVAPRCFAYIEILNYCGKIYTKNVWKDPDEPGKQYVMICHDRMAQQQAWSDNLGIAHFFVREVWFWWAAQQNVIIQEFEKRKTGGSPGRH